MIYVGFQYLVSAFEPFDDEEIIIGLESTAHYADNLIRYLVAEGYNVCVLNPLSTSSMRKNNIRKTKTDKIDTYIIAQTLMMQLHHCPNSYDAEILPVRYL